MPTKSIKLGYLCFAQKHNMPPLFRHPCLIFLVKCQSVSSMGAICVNGRCGLWFMPEGTYVNETVYLNVLKEKLPIFMEINCCTHFQHDGAPCHQTKAFKK